MGHTATKPDKVNIGITKNFRDQKLVICNVIIINSFIISHLLYIELPLYKNNIMKLIYIRSTMEPKNYSTIRSILKKEQGEKIAPYIFKLADTKSLQTYLDKERITYEIYQEERKIINTKKRTLTQNHKEPRKKRKSVEK